MRWITPNLSTVKSNMVLPWYDQPGQWNVGELVSPPRVQVFGQPVPITSILLPTTAGGRLSLPICSVREYVGRAHAKPMAQSWLARDVSYDVGVLVTGLDLGLRIGNSDTSVPYLIVGFQCIISSVQRELLAQIPTFELFSNAQGVTLARDRQREEIGTANMVGFSGIFG